MSEVKLGTTPAPSAERDAIHIAVAPVVAQCELRPGQRVSVSDGVASPSDSGIGIVDPFKKTSVLKGNG